MGPRVLQADMMLNMWFEPHDGRVVDGICVPQKPAIQTMILGAAFPEEIQVKKVLYLLHTTI